MTDLEFFKEFLKRFGREEDILIEKNSYSEVYEVLLTDANDEECGTMIFTFSVETGESIEPPYFSDCCESNLEEVLRELNADDSLGAIEVLVDHLRNDYY